MIRSRRFAALLLLILGACQTLAARRPAPLSLKCAHPPTGVCGHHPSGK